MTLIKREKLTKAEEKKLLEFIGTCVINNVKFPSIQVGGSNLTIQDILHDRTIDSLGKYNDFLETTGGKLSRLDKINNVEEKTIPGSTITYAETVENIDLILKNKMYEEYKASIEKRRVEIIKDLEKYETPVEKKNKLKKELEKLNSI